MGYHIFPYTLVEDVMIERYSLELDNLTPYRICKSHLITGRYHIIVRPEAGLSEPEPECHCHVTSGQVLLHTAQSVDLLDISYLYSNLLPVGFQSGTFNLTLNQIILAPRIMSREQ